MLSIRDYREEIRSLGLHAASKQYKTLAELASPGVHCMSASIITAPHDVPSFHNSQMDGFVVDPEDAQVAAWLANPEADSLTLPLQPMVAAGHEPPDLLPGHAMPIMTGAKLPADNNSWDEDPTGLCVVPVEETVEGFANPHSVTFTAKAVIERGRFVRPRGSDVHQGDTVLSADEEFTPAKLGVLASLGETDVCVFTPPRVLLVTTGDEVVQPGHDRHRAQIYDSNRYAATAALHRIGGNVVDHLHVRDDPHELIDKVTRWRTTDESTHPNTARMVISSGGISKGAREVVRMAAEVETTSAMEFTTVAMQPGGPQAVGHLAGLPWVGLPGNPVSTLVSIQVLLNGALFQPYTNPLRTEFTVRTEDGRPLASPVNKTQFRLARFTPEHGLRLATNPSSHLLFTYARSDVLVEIPAGVDTIYDGDTFNGIYI